MKMEKVLTDRGLIDAPGVRHEKCNHLCVTMTNFGRFEITHIKSGKLISSKYERMSSAYRDMIALEIALIQMGIPSDLDTDEFMSEVKKSTIVPDVLGVSFIEWIRLNKIIDTEFPWESYDDSPYGKAEELIEKLNEMTK